MTKQEKIEINEKKLKSAIFHLNAAYKQIGYTYNTAALYTAINNALTKAKERLEQNETQT